MTELDKLEQFLQDNHVNYIRRPLFYEEPDGPEVIAVFNEGVQLWNAIYDTRTYGGMLEHTGRLTRFHNGKTGVHTAAELIEIIEQDDRLGFTPLEYVRQYTDVLGTEIIRPGSRIDKTSMLTTAAYGARVIGSEWKTDYRKNLG